MQYDILGCILEEEQQNNEKKMEEIQVKPVVYLIVLYQYEFLSFDNYTVTVQNVSNSWVRGMWELSIHTTFETFL